MAPASFLLWSSCLCAWAGLRAPTAIPHHQPLPLSLLPASTSPVSPWQAAAAAPAVASLGWKTKGNGVGATHHCSELQHAQQALGTPDFEGCWRCRGAQGCRNFPRRSQQMVSHAPYLSSLHVPSKKAALLAERGEGGEGLLCFSLFLIWQSSANRWSCAEQRPLTLAERRGSSSQAWNSNY